MNQNGYATQRSINTFLKENWLLLVVLFGLLGWGARIEGKTNSNETQIKERTQIIQKMSEDITDIKQDVAFIKGKYEK